MLPHRFTRGADIATRNYVRRERFISAAIELFGTHGYTSQTVDAVCAQAGLSKRQFYELFDSRDDVLLAAYDTINIDAATAVSHARTHPHPSDTPTQAALRLVTAYLESVTADPHRVRIAFTEIVGVNDRVEHHRQTRRDHWCHLITGVLHDITSSTSAARTYGHTLGATALIGAITTLAQHWHHTTPHPPTHHRSDHHPARTHLRTHHPIALASALSTDNAAPGKLSHSIRPLETTAPPASTQTRAFRTGRDYL